jgi:hypothetical protein
VSGHKLGLLPGRHNLLFYGDDRGPTKGSWVSPGSSWSVCSVKRRFSSASTSISPSGCGPDRFIAAFIKAALFPEVRRHPFRCNGSFCVYAMISTSAGGGSALTLCILSTPGWAYNYYFWVLWGLKFARLALLRRLFPSCQGRMESSIEEPLELVWQSFKVFHPPFCSFSFF